MIKKFFLITLTLHSSLAVAEQVQSQNLSAYRELNSTGNKGVNAPNINVSEKKIPISLTQPNKELATEEINQVAGGVNIIDSEVIREGRLANFQDSLGLAAGVFVQSRFGAEESRLSIRGSGLQRTFHGRGIKLMQDGIPTNLADGGFDFPGIDPYATDYIQVYRGANALQYGASNLGGAINFISRTGYTAPKFEARSEVGSFGFYKLGLSSAGVSGDWDYFVTLNRYGQQGYRDDSQQQAERLSANVGYRIADNIETRFFAGYINSDSELPSTLSKLDLRNNPRKSNFIPGQGVNQRDTNIWRLANKTVWQWQNTQLELGAYYANKELFHPIIDLGFLGPFAPTLGVIDQKTDDYGIYARLSKQAKLFGKDNDFIVGMSPTYGETKDRRYRNFNATRGPLTNEFNLTAYNYELFAENRLHLNSNLTLNIGLQYAYSKRIAEDKLIAVTGDESFKQSFSQYNPKIGLIYQLEPSTQLFANISRTFEPPSFGEMVNIRPPQPLKAQDGITYEIGSRGNSQFVDWDIALYHSRLNNELLQIALNNYPNFANFTVNANRTKHSGLEMGMTARLPAMLEWRHSLLVNDFRFDDDEVYGNSRLPGIPKILLRAELMYRQNGFYAGPTVELSPERYAVDFAQTLYADSYTVLGFRAGQQVNQQLSWFIDARNLTDKKYAPTSGVVRAATANQAIFYPGDGSAVYAGLQWRY